MNASTCCLNGPLNIYTVAEHHAVLTRQRDSAARLLLDLGGVDEVDGAGWQLLWLHGREAALAGRPLQFCRVPDCVREVFATMGLVEWLAAAIADAPQETERGAA